MKTFIQNGKTMTIIAPTGGVESGSLVILGDTVGIAANGALEGNKVEIAMEGVLHIPQTSGSAYKKPTADPTRPSVLYQAFVCEEPGLDDLFQERSHQTATSQIRISFDKNLETLVIGDLLQAVERSGKPLFEIIRLHNDGVSKTTAWVVVKT